MNKILAIIVTYNPSIDKLKVLVSELISQNTDVVIVDNKSENSVELESLMPTYISLLDQNYGIAYAQNIGIKQAFNCNYEYVVFFDQDSSIPRDMIYKMFELYQKISKNYKIGCLGPAYIDIKTGITAPAIQLSFLKTKKIFLNKNKEFTKSDYIISSGTLVTTENIKEIGVMDEKLFIDFVDIEWGMRAKKKGYTCFIANEIVMKHCIGEHSIKIPILNKYFNVHSLFRRYFILRNGIYLILYSDLPINWKILQIIRTFQYFLIFSIFITPRISNIKIFYIATKDAIFKKMYKGSI
ncbi:glycosyltransferase family 2 protein [Acinetobacter sp. WCHAc010052]|uniref:glycosyltransferase family 2 protein n=1 Tax=Acinetobacter sp. WCHAc010052 TaxID=2004647 RepID=UPI000B3C498B|nr:glycosyltransferase family 2 protein [Acinetobacter sp. WCHAc010052]AXY58906.1 glycosyltransferase family 2 protein [Acinetobacter sp. WCHAc010052]